MLKALLEALAESAYGAIALLYCTILQYYYWFQYLYCGQLALPLPNHLAPLNLQLRRPPRNNLQRHPLFLYNNGLYPLP